MDVTYTVHNYGAHAEKDNVSISFLPMREAVISWRLSRMNEKYHAFTISTEPPPGPFYLLMRDQ